MLDIYILASQWPYTKRESSEVQPAYYDRIHGITRSETRLIKVYVGSGIVSLLTSSTKCKREMHLSWNRIVKKKPDVYLENGTFY